MFNGWSFFCSFFPLFHWYFRLWILPHAVCQNTQLSFSTLSLVFSWKIFLFCSFWSLHPVVAFVRNMNKLLIFDLNVLLKEFLLYLITGDQLYPLQSESMCKLLVNQMLLCFGTMFAAQVCLPGSFWSIQCIH